jgi:hypothetical protein
VTIARALSLLAALAFSQTASPEAGLPLRVVAAVPLTGPANPFDYKSVDPVADRLYISHIDGDRLLIFDLRHRHLVKTFNTPGVHGVITVPQLHRVFASITNVKQVVCIRKRQGRSTATSAG